MGQCAHAKSWMRLLHLCAPIREPSLRSEVAILGRRGACQKSDKSVHAIRTSKVSPGVYRRACV
jgi:hypothetical protein